MRPCSTVPERYIGKIYFPLAVSLYQGIVGQIQGNTTTMLDIKKTIAIITLCGAPIIICFLLNNLVNSLS